MKNEIKKINNSLQINKIKPHKMGDYSYKCVHGEKIYRQMLKQKKRFNKVKRLEMIGFINIYKHIKINILPQQLVCIYFDNSTSFMLPHLPETLRIIQVLSINEPIYNFQPHRYRGKINNFPRLVSKITIDNKIYPKREPREKEIQILGMEIMDKLPSYPPYLKEFNMLDDNYRYCLNGFPAIMNKLSLNIGDIYFSIFDYGVDVMPYVKYINVVNIKPFSPYINPSIKDITTRQKTRENRLQKIFLRYAGLTTISITGTLDVFPGLPETVRYLYIQRYIGAPITRLKNECNFLRELIIEKCETYITELPTSLTTFKVGTYVGKYPVFVAPLRKIGLQLNKQADCDIIYPHTAKKITIFAAHHKRIQNLPDNIKLLKINKNIYTRINIHTHAFRYKYIKTIIFKMEVIYNQQKVYKINIPHLHRNIVVNKLVIQIKQVIQINNIVVPHKYFNQNIYTVNHREIKRPNYSSDTYDNIYITSIRIKLASFLKYICANKSYIPPEIYDYIYNKFDFAIQI